MASIRDYVSGKYARETFLTGIIVGFGGIASVVLGIPLVGYFLTPLIKSTPRVWRDVGALSNFVVGKTVEVKYALPPSPYLSQTAGTTSKAGAWLRRDSSTTFTAFSMYCTHLGCPVHWLPTAQLFLCPCHGSAFYSNGQVAIGPAQIPLVRLPVKLKNGRVLLRTGPIPVA